MPLSDLDDEGLNNVSERQVVFTDGFERFADGSSNDPNDRWVFVDANASVTSTRPYEGSRSIEVNDTGDTSRWMYTDCQGRPTPDVITSMYWETGDAVNHGIGVYNSNGRMIFYMGSDNPQLDISDADGTRNVYDPNNPEYQAWRRYTLTIDYDVWEYDLLWQDVTGNESDRTYSGRLKQATAEDVAFIALESIDGSNSLVGYYDMVTAFEDEGSTG